MCMYMTSVFYSCARTLVKLWPFPDCLPEPSRTFPDCGFLIGLETQLETGNGNGDGNGEKRAVETGSRKIFGMGPLASRQQNVICSFPFPTFFLAVNTRAGLGKSIPGGGGVEITRNGEKRDLRCSCSLPGSLAGTFPDLPGLRVFWKVGFYLPVSLPGTFPDLAGLQVF